MLATNPVMFDVNEPVPPPSEVFVVNATIGLGLVLQTTPRAVTVSPPALVTFPPQIAEVLFTLDIELVPKVDNKSFKHRTE